MAGILNITPKSNELRLNRQSSNILTDAGASKNMATSEVSSARTTISGNVIRVISTEAQYIKLGDVTVVAAAGDMYLAPNVPEYLAVDINTHIAAIDVA